MNLLNKIVTTLFLGLILIFVHGCGSDDEVEPTPTPTPTPLMDFRVSSFNLFDDDELLETTTITYDANNRVEKLINKDPAGVILDSISFSYDGNNAVYNSYVASDNDFVLVGIFEVEIDNNGFMTRSKVTTFDNNAPGIIDGIFIQDFTYLDNQLVEYLYQVDFDVDGTFELTNESTINWDGEQLQSFVTNSSSAYLHFIDSTLFEYNGELISLFRTLRSDNGGEFTLLEQNEPNYENDLFVSNYIQDFFTDENGFTFPVSQATIDLYSYNEDGLLDVIFRGNNRREVVYEMGDGNFGRYFSCLVPLSFDEHPEYCVLGIWPRVW